MSIQKGAIVVRGPRWSYGDQDGGPGYLGRIVDVYWDKDYCYTINWLFHPVSNVYRNNDVIEVNSGLDQLSMRSIYRKLIDLLKNEHLVLNDDNLIQFMELYQKIKQEGISLVSIFGQDICDLLDDPNLIYGSKNLSLPNHHFKSYCQKIFFSTIFNNLKNYPFEKQCQITLNNRFDIATYFETNDDTYSSEFQLFIRNNLLVQGKNINYDWFGYRNLWNTVSKSLLCPLDSTKNCVFCEEALSKEETSYTKGLKADCGCFYHLECLIDLGNSIQGLAKNDIKAINLGCLGGCSNGEMTTELYRNILAIMEFNKFQHQQRPKKVADLVKYFDVEGDLTDFINNQLKKNNFKEEVEFLNQKVIRKIILQNALWVNPCPKCDWNALIDPEEEKFSACFNCKHKFLIQGSIKKDKDDQSRPTLIELIKKNPETMGYCKTCFKVINKNGGCSHIICSWCNSEFYWKNFKESDYDKIHY